MEWILYVSAACIALAFVLMALNPVRPEPQKQPPKKQGPIYDWRGSCKLCGRPKHDEVKFL